MSELLRKVVAEAEAGNIPLKEKLQKVGHTFMRGSEVSAQEAAYCVLGLPLSMCSRDVEYINTSIPEERVKITKSLQELRKLPPNSTEMTVPGMLNHYENRPDELERVSLAQFAAYWTYSKTKGRRVRNCFISKLCDE
jgi:hypothetical protein